MGPREWGLLLGAMIGSVLIGALFGWIVRLIFRLRWMVADGIGILLMVPIAALSASMNAVAPFGPALGLYTAGGAIAWVALYLLRGRGEPPLPAQHQGRWKRPLGIILIVPLIAIGATAMFSAFRQVVQPSVFGGSPEFLFFAGMLLLAPCFFIYRYLIR